MNNNSKGSSSAYGNTDQSPGESTSYDYKKDCRDLGMMNELKVSKDSVPTWSSSDMNEAKIKTK